MSSPDLVELAKNALAYGLSSATEKAGLLEALSTAIAIHPIESFSTDEGEGEGEGPPIYPVLRKPVPSAAGPRRVISVYESPTECFCPELAYRGPFLQSTLMELSNPSENVLFVVLQRRGTIPRPISEAMFHYVPYDSIITLVNEMHPTVKIKATSTDMSCIDMFNTLIRVFQCIGKLNSILQML